MRKKYSKPFLKWESFQLDAAIAASCSSQGFIPIGHGENNCTYKNDQFFNYDNCQCDVTGPEDDGNDAVCYHGPEASMGEIFISS